MKLMSYTKLAAVIFRATSVDIRKILPARCRSTSASSKCRESGKKAHVDESTPVNAAQGSQSKNAENVRADGIEVDFDNTEEAYRSKTNAELLRSLLVFKLCSFDLLVDKNKELMELGRKLLGRWLFEKAMKMTFYGHFVAGEDLDSVKALVRKNRAFGVGAVLDYSVEEDLTRQEAEDKEMDSCVSRAEREDPHSVGRRREEKYKFQRQFGDRRGGVTAARTYFYADEAKCDDHLETFVKCIRASGGNSADGFSAVKMSALGRPQFLLQFSEVLVRWRRFFDLLAAQQGQSGVSALERKLDRERLKESLADLGVGEKDVVDKWFPGPSSGTIDLLDWNGLIDHTMEMSSLLVVPDPQSGRPEPLLERFTAEEERQRKRMLQRADLLAQHAAENGVRLMVDAEQTYFQPAIGRLTLEMQRRFNRRTAVVFNTYQCYLREALDAVSLDAALARREGWHFGAKLVRGAYMHQERARARQVGYDDPVHPDREATDRTYRRCLELLLEEVAAAARGGGGKACSVMVATHNEDTVRFALETMSRMGLLSSPSARGQVSFGQLLGMCDQVSFPLGQAGLPVYKYVPYGPVGDVLPYLSRRALENRDVVKGSRRERRLLWTELKRRLLSGQLVHNPVY